MKFSLKKVIRFGVHSFLLFAFATVAKADQLPSHIAHQPHIQVELVSAPVKEGSGYLAGVVFRPDPGWHIYWRNPGDTGLAPNLKWSADGAELESGALHWPFPEIVPISHLVNIGYHDEVVLWREFASLPEGLKVDVDWLVCKESCIPGSASLSLRSVKDRRAEAFDFDAWQGKLPDAMALMGASVKLEGGVLALDVYAQQKFIPEGAKVEVLVENLDVVSYGPPEQLIAANNVVMWRQSLSEYFVGLPDVLNVVVVVDRQKAYSFAVKTNS